MPTIGGCGTLQPNSVPFLPLVYFEQLCYKNSGRLIMFETVKFFFELRRYPNFWDWLRATNSREILTQLTAEATDCALIRPWSPFADTFVGSGLKFEDRVNMIYKRFGGEIWDICLGAGGYGEHGSFGLECLARLPLQSQVHDTKSFLEFMVRNAIRRAAQQIIEEA
jgi:hypothetical protein